MKYIKLFFYYIRWHYTAALSDYFRIWRNLLWFVLNFFSVKILIKTIHKPFFHLNEKTTLAKVEKEDLIVTILAGIFGFIFRLVSIVVGVIAWLFILIFGLLSFILWFLLPAILIFMLVCGVAAIIQSSPVLIN